MAYRQIALDYDDTLVRTAVLSFWRKTVGKGYFAALAVLTIAFFVLLFSGDKSWMVGLLGGTLFFAIAIIAVLYVVHYRNSFQKFKRMASHQAQLSLSDESFTLSSELGETTLPWSSVSEIWKFDQFWLLLFSKAQFVILPMKNFSIEDREFLLQYVRKAGGKDS